MPRTSVRTYLHTIVKSLNHQAFELGALRRELAERGLAKPNARAKELSPGLADRLYSSAPRGSSASTPAGRGKTRRASRSGRARSSASRAETTD